MEEWKAPNQYTSGLRNLLQRHFKKITAGEWFAGGAVLVPTRVAESIERTWGRGSRQPHPKWVGVVWEEVRVSPLPVTPMYLGICVYIHMHANMCKPVSIFMYMDICIYIYIYRYIKVYISIHTHISTLTHLNTHTDTHVYIYIFIHKCMYTYKCTCIYYIYIYIYIHI